MILNYNILTKFFLTLLAIFISTYFFLIGFITIENYQLKQLNTDNFFEQKKLKKETKSKINNNINQIENKISEKNNQLNQNQKQKNITLIDETIIEVKKNDTFDKIIKPFFRNQKIKNEVITLLNKEYDLKNLKIGQKIILYKDAQDIIKKIIMPVNFSTDIIIQINNNGINLTKKNIQIIKDIVSHEFIVSSSIYKDGIKAQIPLKILSEVIRLYSFDVDFQRDIQKNDKLQLSYEIFSSDSRENLSFGKIQYIKLNLQKNILEYFLFETDDGYYDYFNAKGKNVKKALLKTPIDGARLSSSFGMRKHPISGFNKLHKGVDFAAPSGTPIYAGGNGVVEFIGRNGGYGKYIRIRHNNSYKTAYAHLKSYKKGLYKGQRVNQGDVIGYVGSTGKSTGPHLHYEIIYQNKQINPMKMKLPSGKTLKGEELKRFQIESKKIYANFLFSQYE